MFQDDAAPGKSPRTRIDADFADDGDDEFDHWISRRPFHAHSRQRMTDPINRTKLVALMERILARIEADPDIKARPSSSGYLFSPGRSEVRIRQTGARSTTARTSFSFPPTTPSSPA